MTLITVIIVNYNSGVRLARALDCLAAQSFTDFETIVIDNASSDDSLERARRSGLPVKFIEAGSNLGFAAANNRAAEQSSGEWLAFLNPDAYATPGWLAALVAASERYPFADAFGSTQVDAADPTKIDGAGDVYHVLGIPYRGHFGWPVASLPAEGECFAPCAAAALYRRSTFLALGGFDEDFFCYGEDVDLGFRLRLAGGRAVQVRDAVVHHEGSAVTGRYSDFTIYHGNRNRIWTLWQNMPSLFFWPLLPIQIGANLYLLARSWSVGRAAPYWRALRDGYGAMARLAGKRRRNLRARKASLRSLARALTWSPLKVSRRAADLKPLDEAGVGAPRRPSEAL